MPAFHMFAATQRGGMHIMSDQRLSHTGEMSVATMVHMEEQEHKQWQIGPLLRAVLVLLANIILGVCAGMIFREIERPEELRAREARALLVQRLGGNRSMPIADWEELMAALGHSATDLENDVAHMVANTMDQQDLDWDYSSSMFFAFTVATSIGYGTFAPVTVAGRVFTIVYALLSIPLMLSAFTHLTQLLLKWLASRLSGRKRDLPYKVFRMLDRDRTGTLNKAELIVGLKLLGLGDYSGRGSTLEKRRRLESLFHDIDRDNSGELELQEFRLLLQRLVPDEDQVLILVDVVTRSYVALVSVGCFLAMVLTTAGAFVYLKREEDWTFISSLYYTIITFFTIGLGDLAPDPHPGSYMVAWVFCTFFGLGFTTAMVQTLADPNLNFRASLRGLCPNFLTGQLGQEALRQVDKKQVTRQRVQKAGKHGGSSRSLFSGSHAGAEEPSAQPARSSGKAEGAAHQTPQTRVQFTPPAAGPAAKSTAVELPADGSGGSPPPAHRSPPASLPPPAVDDSAGSGSGAQKANGLSAMEA